MRVGVVQFIKGKWMTGERLQAARTEGLDFFVMGEGFTWESDDIGRDKAAAQAAWQKSRDLILGAEHPIVILDEISYAINYGWIDLDELLAVLADRPPETSVVLTGRHAPERLLAMADLVTEMSKIKHPYDQGRKALLGVDY